MPDVRQHKAKYVNIGVVFLFLWLVAVTKILRAITGVEIQLVKNGSYRKTHINKIKLFGIGRRSLILTYHQNEHKQSNLTPSNFTNGINIEK